MIKAVLFDLDETLLDRRSSLLDFLTAQCTTLGLEGASAAAFIDRFLTLDDNGRVWKDLVYEQLSDEFSLRRPHPALLADYVDRFRDFALPFEGVLPALAALKESGLALGIISNGRHDFQMSVIESLGLLPFMSTVLVSESEEVRKPELEIFRRALARLNAQPFESIFVGDNPAVDIAGARKVGMKAVWFYNTVFSPPPDEDCNGVLRNFSDLARMVSALD